MSIFDRGQLTLELDELNNNDGQEQGVQQGGTTPDSGTPQKTTPDSQEQEVIFTSDDNGPLAMDEQTGLLIPAAEAERKNTALANTGQPQPASSQTSYDADWGSGISIEDVAKGSNKTRLELIQDRERWARDTGGAPLDIFELATLAQGHDLSMSKADEEAAAKKQARKEKWERYGNVLAHLGNFIGALAGAPSQELEDAVELTKRQQALRERTEALRTGNNRFAIELLLKDRADKRAQDAAERTALYQQRQLDQGERKLSLAEKREDRMEAQMWLNEAFRDRQMTFKEGQAAALQAYRNGQLSLGAARIAIAEMKAGDYTITTTEDAVNPLTGQPYQKSKTQTRTQGGSGRQNNNGGNRRVISY